MLQVRLPPASTYVRNRPDQSELREPFTIVNSGTVGVRGRGTGRINVDTHIQPRLT